MDLVNDIDLVAGFGGHKHYLIRKPADIIYRVMRGCVYFHNVQKSAGIYALADGAFITGIAIMRVKAVNGFGKDLGHGGFTRPPRTCEQVGMSNITADHRLF